MEEVIIRKERVLACDVSAFVDLKEMMHPILIVDLKEMMYPILMG